MNYIHLVNGFWQCDLEHPFTPNDTRLYFFLLHTCNSLAWKMPFGHSDRHLALKLGASVNTIREAKNRLKQRGLIDFKVPDKKSKSFEGQTKYWLKELTVSKIDTVIPPTVSDYDTDGNTDTGTDGCTVPDTDTDTNNKLNETKPNIKVYKSKEQVFELPFQSDEFEKQWGAWVKFKKEKKQSLTPSTVEAQFKKLKGYTEETAIGMIKQSIEKGWQGLFEIKQPSQATVYHMPQQNFYRRTASDPSLNQW